MNRMVECQNDDGIRFKVTTATDGTVINIELKSDVPICEEILAGSLVELLQILVPEKVELEEESFHQSDSTLH